jgi:hypothetical protein
MQRPDPQRHLSAIKLVRRATAQAGDLQQSGYYGIQGQRADQPWVRQGCPSSFAEIDRQDECLNVWSKAAGHYVEFPEIRSLAEMADLEFQGNMLPFDVWINDPADTFSLR